LSRAITIDGEEIPYNKWDKAPTNGEEPGYGKIM